ncbi:hypothetical protein L218DRAFT_1003041 [Marasmius fiardii PR-910]|nr:hypothetical protein L218DRAFT_1003041 [Marasmius fiardii PR-910]
MSLKKYFNSQRYLDTKKYLTDHIFSPPLPQVDDSSVSKEYSISRAVLAFPDPEDDYNLNSYSFSPPPSLQVSDSSMGGGRGTSRAASTSSQSKGLIHLTPSLLSLPRVDNSSTSSIHDTSRAVSMSPKSRSPIDHTSPPSLPHADDSSASKGHDNSRTVLASELEEDCNSQDLIDHTSPPPPLPQANDSDASGHDISRAVVESNGLIVDHASFPPPTPQADDLGVNSDSGDVSPTVVLSSESEKDCDSEDECDTEDEGGSEEESNGSEEEGDSSEEESDDSDISPAILASSDSGDDYNLKYLIHHIFFPPRLPQADDSSMRNEHDVCRAVLGAALVYQEHKAINKEPRWSHVIAMLQRLCNLYKPHSEYTKSDLVDCISNMNNKDVATLLIRKQNAGLIIRKLQDRTIFESFEVSAPNKTIMSNSGKLICSFPGPAIAIPSDKASDQDFISSLADFLVQMNSTMIEDAMPTTDQAGSKVTETQDTAHPRFITELLTGILRGIGRPEDVKRLTKRIADDVIDFLPAGLDTTKTKDTDKLPVGYLRSNGESQDVQRSENDPKGARDSPWRRSPLWLVIRVALQTSLRDPDSGSDALYKSFMAFLMSRILFKAVNAGFGSDTLSIMHKKLARRAYKIRDTPPRFLMHDIKKVGDMVQGALKERWEEAQEEERNAGLKGWDPSRLDPFGDTVLSLNNSKAYISAVLKGDHGARSSVEFKPNESPRLMMLEQYSVNNLSDALRELGALALFDFERAVGEGIDSWISKRLTSEVACLTVWKWIEEYHKHAEPRYKGNPEETSMMYLTLLELWIGLDKLCVEQCPLLLDYSPGMIDAIFQPLLLRQSESIERLKRAVQYLRNRHSRATNSDAIFCQSILSFSFSVQFFDSSQKLQNLKRAIESQARRDRQRKEEELQDMNKQYYELVREEQLMVCENSRDRRGCEYHDEKWCTKCRLKAQYTDMKIQVFEWPLPSRTEEAKAAVFEIACPVVFGVWRQATYHVLLNIFTPSKLHPKPSSAYEKLPNYDGLSRFVDHTSVKRLSLASATESWTRRTHYNSVELPTTTDKVCLDNGLRLALFDLSKQVWVSSFTHCSIESDCTYELPLGSYANLQWTLNSTRHTANEVLASQSECHKELGLPEYVAYGSLRAGERLQWPNILRELHARTLTFSQHAVEMLVSQAALQSGSLTRKRCNWKWHKEMYNPEFQLRLLDELDDLLRSLTENWSEVGTMRIIILLARCVLSRSRDDNDNARKACQRALGVLRECRWVAYRWMKDVSEKLQAAGGDSEDVVREFRHRLCEMAATCRSTCDVGLRWYERACRDDPSQSGGSHGIGDDTDSDLDTSSASQSWSTLSMILEAGIILRENMPLSLTDSGVSQVIRQLIVQDGRFSHSSEQFLTNALLESNDALHDAIGKYWPAYSRTRESCWCQIPAPNDRWLYLKGGAQLVHFDVLHSQLLVDGKPIGRLPSKFVSHPTYKRMFRQAILDVIPPDRTQPDMEFAAKDLFKVEDPVKLEYQVFFAYRSDELIVKKTLRPSSNTHRAQHFELIPHTRLLGDLPSFLVEDYAHWLSLDDGVIELCPLTDPWNTSPAHWRIVFGIDAQSSPYMYRPSVSGAQLRLVDVRSSTASMLISRLQVLEKNEFMTITYLKSELDEIVKVEVPRYRLSFQLTSTGEFLCTTLPNMAVDDNQSAGIMIGLVNKLVLKNTKCDGRRELLLPLGTLSASQPGTTSHTKVSIDVGAKRRVLYYRYMIDSPLGRLVGDTNLHAKLWRVYLTAVTSSCLPDPLTGRTGTHEALAELKSASCRSFITLEDEDRNLLLMIANLTPRRLYRPHRLQVMQTVQWRVLPSLAQHDGFLQASQDILDFASRLEVFGTKQSPKSDESTSGTEILVKRAAARNMWFSPPEFHFQCPEDVIHQPRSISDSSAESVVFSNSVLVDSWPTQLATIPDLLQKLKEWSSGKSELAGPSNEILMIPYIELNRPMAEIWMTLYNHLRSNITDQYQVLFMLCSLGYFNKLSDIQTFIPSLLSFATNQNQFSNLNPPQWSSYILSEGFKPNRESLIRAAKDSGKVFVSGDYVREVPSWSNETNGELDLRRRAHYKKELELEAEAIVDYVIHQWPCRKPLSQWQSIFCIVTVKDFMSKAEPMFAHWYHNWELHNHFDAVQQILDLVHTTPPHSKPDVYTFDPCLGLTVRPLSSHIPLNSLFIERKAPLNLHPLPNTVPSIRTSVAQDSCSPHCGKDNVDCSSLQLLVDELRGSSQQIHHTYANDLSQSLKMLQSMDNNPPRVKSTTCTKDIIPMLCKYRDRCEKHFHKCFQAIQGALSSSKSRNHAEVILQQANLSPSLELRSVLQSMSSTSSLATPLPETWINSLCHLTQSLILFQRSLRLLHMAQLGKNDDLEKEVNVDESVLAVDNCDWLLIQAENDFLVRDVQLTVAGEMTSPSRGEGTLLQLNMGEGKSSVIVPLVAAAIADGKKLLRVVVLKSLATQMFSLLQQRLGGLVNRQILYFPFSRNVKIGDKEAVHIQQLYEYAVNSRAILVVQPEHLLSFKVMAINQLIERDALSHQLIKTQLWLDDHARDVLDESDEILHTRYQLIYTVGAQQTLELGSDRWRIIQEILLLARECAEHVQKSYPLGLDIGNSDNQFPLIRVLKHEAGEKLVSRVLKMVMEGNLSTCNFERFSPRHIQLAEHFIVNDSETLSDEDVRILENDFGTTLWKKLLLLRGLLGQGILLYVLQHRRWRVDFGLDLSRSLLAVPYRAKDVPSLQAEFGHPDVAIMLTCLSYLYGGLSQSEVDTTLQLLFKLDNPKLEYENWVQFASNVPENLCTISGVNLKDSGHIRDTVFPLFRANPVTINFYLSHVVFPRAAREFPKKLTTTGWDLARQKNHVMTGFSGTNDNRHLLPTSIAQVDTPDRIGTNAQMLSVLLAPENDHYMSLSTPVLSGKEIINAIVDGDGTAKQPDIRVLLDVGAQILGMSNVEVARYWLTKRPDLEAAIFFNEHGDLQVIMHDGTTELLGLSPFNGNFDQCLVYLDDAHTRGTDLKLPTDWKACVTLGPKVTKDRLAQGCMRMRKLGRGQSIVYMAPRDVDSVIRERAKKGDDEIISSRDVVLWAMLETCADIKHYVPHWVQQGVDFAAREEGWKKLAAVPEDPLQALEAIKSSWLRPEARSLQEMYNDSSKTDDNSLSKLVRAMPEIWSRCEALGVTEFGDPRVEEEQEREQEREVHEELEREPQIERPSKAKPKAHVLHPDVVQFIKTGIVPTGSDAFDDAFPPLMDSAGSTNVLRWNGPKSLLATRDFLETIQTTSSVSLADFLHPVNWVVSSPRTRSLVILSPYEANELLPTIRHSKRVQLHVYVPRVAQVMQPVDDLKLHSFRPLSLAWKKPEQRVVDLLNLYAGQLYFSDYETYRRISAFLGIRTREDTEMKSEGDGFVKPENRVGHLKSDCSFDSSPLPYLKALIGSRRKGITFEPTHVGKVLQGRYVDFDSKVV